MVVDDLEREPEVVPELLRRDAHLGLHRRAREQRGRLARVGDERGGLAVGLGEVVVHGGAFLLRGRRLHDLALDERLERHGHGLHNLDVVQARQRRVSEPSRMSSWTSDAVWIISVIAPSSRCCLAIFSRSTPSPAASSVARPIRQTITGRTRFPSRVSLPPKKYCAEAMSTSLPPPSWSQTIWFRFSTSALAIAKGFASGFGSCVTLWQLYRLK